MGLCQTEEASGAFKKVTELNPNYADAYINMGVVLKMQGNLEDAIKGKTKTPVTTSTKKPVKNIKGKLIEIEVDNIVNNTMTDSEGHLIVEPDFEEITEPDNPGAFASGSSQIGEDGSDQTYTQPIS